VHITKNMDELAAVLGVDAGLLKQQAEGGRIIGGVGETCLLHAPARCACLSYDVYQREGRWCARQWCGDIAYAHLELEPFSGWPLRPGETSYVCDDRYLDPEQAMPADARTVILKTQTGSGKTTAIASQLPPGSSCWILSTRVLLVNDLVKRFGHLGFISYRDLRDWSSPPNRLVITIHSLHKLRGNCPDVLVLDESESLLSEIFSNKVLNQWSSRVLAQLRGLCRRCQLVIAADANASPLTLETVRAWRRCTPRPHLVWSSFVAPIEQRPRAIVTTNLSEWTRDISQRHAQGKIQYTFANFLSALQPLCGGRTLFLTRETSSAEKDALGDIDKLVDCGQLQHVLASPTIESGVSLESSKFDCVNVALVDSTTDPPSALQGMMRVRKTKVINLCLVNIVPVKSTLRKQVSVAGNDLASLYKAQQARFYNDWVGSLLRLMTDNGLSVVVDVASNRRGRTDNSADERQARELLAAADIDTRRAAEIRRLINTHQDTPGLKLQLKKHRLTNLFKQPPPVELVTSFGLHRDFVLDKLEAYVSGRPDSALKQLYDQLQVASVSDLQTLLPRARTLLPPALKDDIFASGAARDTYTLAKLTDLVFFHLTGIRQHKWKELSRFFIKLSVLLRSLNSSRAEFQCL